MTASTDTQPLPSIVSESEWRAARQALLAREKDLTHARDALAAERRRLPMVRVEKEYVFLGPEGNVSLRDLFAGRRQLLLYHFMFAPGVHGWPAAGCPGCSMFVDNIGQFTPVHLQARDISLALVSRAPLANIQAYRQRMSWPHRWVSSEGNTFNVDYGLTTQEGEGHGLSVLLRDGAEIFRTYFTSARGSEGLGNVWGFLDATPFGRQETWEDSPPGWPQTPPYQWWRRHDEYGSGPISRG
jgi:predicted dithiol-disulfide oxidoreductase (DUF899 family)